MAATPSGHIEQLPSGSFRVHVYGGIDPITRRRIYFRQTAKTLPQAQIVLGKLLEQAQAGKQPESGATVAQLLDQYVLIAEWDLSTREGYEGYIRRTIKPALGHLQVRKVRGPVLDMLYARLKKCGDLACNGRPFTEHRTVPDLRPDPAARPAAWEQAAGALREAIRSGVMPAGSPLPSVRELQSLQGIRRTTLQHAFSVLADEGLIVVRHGRNAVVAGEDDGEPGKPRLSRPGPGHDCTLAGCQRHVCKPMKAGTIRQVHSILSGAFDTAQRWEWTDRNPADSARPPAVHTRKSIPATPPEDVATVIAEARAHSAALGLYLWLVVITGQRRGELCGLQIRDVDLDQGLIHVAFNYVVKGGNKIRKDTKTHQDRWTAIDPDTCALIANYLAETRAALAAVGAELAATAYLFSNDPGHVRPWNPDWVSHKIAAAAGAAGVDLGIKGGRHYTASQLLAAGFDRRNTAARLGHSGGGATTLRHYADPVPEADRRAAAYLSRLTANAAGAAQTRRQQRSVRPGAAAELGS
jgi:integrase